MKKVVLMTVAMVTLITLPSIAQNVFYGAGLVAGRAFSTPKTYRGFPGNITQASEPFFMVGVAVPVDAQVIPLGEEMTIGFHVEPGFAYTIPVLSNIDDNILLFQSPLIAQFNYGNFSSSDASSELGFGLGFGMMAQFQMSSTTNSEIIAEGNPFVLLPTAQASFRFWGPGNKLYAAKLSHSFGTEAFNGTNSNRGSTFLSVSRYINY